jgi:hypothetical protein
MNSYRHTQVGYAIVVPVAVALVAALAFLARTPQARGVLPWFAALLASVLILFSTLTVTVSAGWLECRFGVGLIRRRIRLDDVREAEAVRNKWYYGWGIRLTPYGWLWNAFGLDAVELTFATGRKFRIGTNEPHTLLGAIRASHSGRI